MVRVISTAGFRRQPIFNFLFAAGEQLMLDGWPKPSRDDNDFVDVISFSTVPETVEVLDGGTLLEEGEFPW